MTIQEIISKIVIVEEHDVKSVNWIMGVNHNDENGIVVSKEFAKELLQIKKDIRKNEEVEFKNSIEKCLRKFLY